MFSRLAEHAIRSTAPLLMQPVAPPDSEGAKEPPLPQPPYTPYAEKPALPETPYKPYSEKPTLHDPPYEPYKGI